MLIETEIGAAKALAAAKRETRRDEGRMFTGEVGEPFRKELPYRIKGYLYLEEAKENERDEVKTLRRGPLRRGKARQEEKRRAKAILFPGGLWARSRRRPAAIRLSTSFVSLFQSS